eukprot:CAMPEP_0174275290 /NCGR_PEP_ID=MMETSP0439-20130205/59743_1 /TAXON_ID=0 /ORGANISM="Stereomyxa ramosa, Strain Chinc5" /LENGTH=254 /DNA_ID=CAMNT_0015367379 /DNA_START=903 /DNA_END=1664 /DNA_ORIENTATION=+
MPVSVEYVGKKFKVEVEVYKWLETNPSLCLSPDCSPFTAAHFGHYASVSRCMRTLEQVELQRGEKFDTVVRLREDTYALGEWKLTRDYDKTLTTLGLFSFGGLCDITYVVSREFASQLLHGLLDFRLPHKIFTLPDDLRYPPNSENWLANVVSFLNIPTRVVSICEMPLVPSRMAQGGLILKPILARKLIDSLISPLIPGRLRMTSLNLTAHSYEMSKKYIPRTSMTCKPKWASKAGEMVQDMRLQQLFKKDGW